MNKRPQQHAGTSLTEVMVSTLLVGLVLVASLDSVGGVARTWRAHESQVDARIVAHQLLTEALAAPYEDPDNTATIEFGNEDDETPAATERSEFDDLDDYHGWTSSPPQYSDGTAIPNLTGWTRSVQVEALSKNSPTTPLGVMGLDEGVRRITVTVIDPDGNTTVLQGIRSTHGAVQQTPGVDTEFVTGVTITLDTVGGRTLVQGTNLINNATGP